MKSNYVAIPVSKSTICWLMVLVLLNGWSIYIYRNNEYMAHKEVPATFIDKYTRQSCYKHGRCEDRFEGLFKTNEGIVFDRPISAYMYRQMRLGEQLTLDIRQIDIRQTTRDNVLWFFLPVFVWAFTFNGWLMVIWTLCEYWYDRKNKRK